MMDLEVQGNAYITQAEQLVSAGASDDAKIALAKQAMAFEEANKGQLPQWMIDQLDYLPNFMGLGVDKSGNLAAGEQVGTAQDPNLYTTKAANMQDPTKAALDTNKIVNDLSQGLNDATKKAVEELVKALTSKAVIIGAVVAGIGAALYFFGRRR